MGLKGVASGGDGEGDAEEAGEVTHSGIHDAEEDLAEAIAAHEQMAEEAKEENRELLEEAREAEERAEGAQDVAPAESGDKSAQKDKKAAAATAPSKPQAPKVKPEELSDGFGQTRMDAYREGLNKLEQAQKLTPGQPMLAPPRKQGTDALSALNNAQDPGVFFKVLEKGEGEGGGQEQPREEKDPELLAAVEEAGRLLFEVKGIRRIAPGQNDEGAKVVVVMVGDRNFTAESVRQVPERVHRFSTLLAIPYDLLPLRRALL